MTGITENPSPQPSWWNRPVAVTRLTATVFSALIALCFVLVIVAAVLYLNDRREQTADRLKHDKAQIEQLTRITTTLRSIQQPTKAEFEQRLKQGVERCLQDPECSKLFPKIGGS